MPSAPERIDPFLQSVRGRLDLRRFVRVAVTSLLVAGTVMLLVALWYVVRGHAVDRQREAGKRLGQWVGSARGRATQDARQPDGQILGRRLEDQHPADAVRSHARVVGHAPAFQGHVEIDTHQGASPLWVNILNGLLVECGHAASGPVRSW